MHPDLEQLLAYRDGECDDEVRKHVEACSQCLGEIQNLKNIRRSLESLPMVELEVDVWPVIKAGIRNSRRNRRIISAAGLVAASLLVIFTVLFTNIGFFKGGQKNGPKKMVNKQEKKVPAELEPLMSRSKLLEQELQKLESRPTVVKGRTAGFIASIQDEVTIVDLQISLLQGDDGSKETLVRLWRERVNLLSTLVRLRSGDSMSAA